MRFIRQELEPEEEEQEEKDSAITNQRRLRNKEWTTF